MSPATISPARPFWTIANRTDSPILQGKLLRHIDTFRGGSELPMRPPCHAGGRLGCGQSAIDHRYDFDLDEEIRIGQGRDSDQRAWRHRSNFYQQAASIRVNCSFFWIPALDDAHPKSAAHFVPVIGVAHEMGHPREVHWVVQDRQCARKSRMRRRYDSRRVTRF